MRKFKGIMISIMAVLGLAAVPLAPTLTVHAQGAAEVIKGSVDEINDGNDATLQDQIKTVVNILLFVLGAIAVIMIIIGGIRYTTSNGDQTNIKAAKDIILYAVVGLAVAILSYAIVNFILDAFTD
jgi:hypothetical protein